MTETSSTLLRREAERLRRLAREIVDEHGQRELLKLAAEYEIRAAQAAEGEGF